MREEQKDLVQSKLYGLAELVASLAAILVVALSLSALAAGFILAADALTPRWLLADSLGATVRRAMAAGSGKALTYFGLAISFLGYACLALAILIAARVRGGRNWRELIAWRPWSLWRKQRWFWLIAGAALLYGFAADFALGYFHPQSNEWLSMPKDRAVAALLSILAVIFAPAAEELLFRGWIFTSLRQNFSFATALLASSAVFAGLHYESTHLYALTVFPVGLALGAIREITGTIKAPIAFHAFNNFLVCVLGFLDIG